MYIFQKQTTKNVLCTFGVFRGVGSHYPLDSNEFLRLLRKQKAERVLFKNKIKQQLWVVWITPT